MSSNEGDRVGQAGPDYEVEVDADELIADLVEMSQDYAEKHDKHRRQYRESLDTFNPWHDARYWTLEALGGLRATSEAIASLQPEAHSPLITTYRNDDGTVDVRALMQWLDQQSTETNERRNGPYSKTRQASEAHSAIASVISLLRDDYGVGWPRFDDLGGELECDLA